MARAAARFFITADSSGVRRGADDAERSISRLNAAAGKSFGALKVGALAAGAAVGVTFAAAMRTGIGEMMEAEKVSAQTAAAIKSTGGAANVTRKQIEDLASALEAKTGIDGQAIQAGQNLLLTFTNLRNEAGKGNDIFNQATRVMTDMSVALGTDAKGSALQLGKALNDPVKGITALTRVGVSFTQQQKDTIKAMVDSGNTIGAQKVILAELNKEFGKSGEAFGNTLPGKLQRMQRAWENVSQSIAVAFMPVMERVADAALRNQAKLQRFANGVAKAVGGMVEFVGAIIAGDWQKAWNMAVAGAGKALTAIGELAKRVLFPLAKQAGAKIVEGLAAGVDEALSRVPGSGALRRILGFESAQVNSTVRVQVIGGSGVAAITGEQTPVSRTATTAPPRASTRDPRIPRQARAMGGFIDGPAGAGDVVPVMASPGEAFLNARQQAMVEQMAGTPGLLRRVFALTGGVVGGRRFAQGGVVTNPLADATAFAKAQVGKAYTPGGTGKGQRTGPKYWDCSGFATYVAAQVPGFRGRKGGTTFSEYASSTPATGREPVVYGFRSYGRSEFGTGYQHMGIRIGGVWYDAGSGGVQVGDARWDKLRVPAGLAGLKVSAAGTTAGGFVRSPGNVTDVRRGIGAIVWGPIGGPPTPTRAKGLADGSDLAAAPSMMNRPSESARAIADAQAAQEQTRIRNAAVVGGASEDFIRAAFGFGDVRGGGANAATASGTQVFIQSLVPDGPDVLRRIAEAVSTAVGSSAYIPAASTPSGA